MSSVKEVLENHGAGERVEEALELVHQATEAGVSKKNATPAILVHMIHLESDKTWAEICDDLDLDINDLLSYRKELVKSDVIKNTVRRPSDIVSGKPREMLKNLENSHADWVFDGTKPSNWVASAIYLDEWISLRGTSPEMVGSQYNCESDTVVELAERLVRSKPFSRTYATESIDGPLGTLLARRRHTIGTLRLSLSDTSTAVEDRLRSVERESKYQLESEEFADETFYWTTEHQG